MRKRPYQSDGEALVEPVFVDGAGVEIPGAQLNRQFTAGGGGAGTVTHTVGALTNHAVTIGSGVTVNDIKSLAAAANGQIIVGVAGADPVVVSVSGDATLDSAGVLTLNPSMFAAAMHRISGGI